MGNIDSLPEIDMREEEEEDVHLAHFKVLKTIGQGAFGKVYKVQHRKQRELYALKVINKERCIKMNAVSNIIRERTIIECLDHPLVCNMRFAFQDTESMFMAMDLMSGGDLRSHISNSTVQQHDERTIQFWMAELICAVKYLHSQGIIHRDIKPDNILLDQQGHVHLSDFNIACNIPEKYEKPLISLSGTAVYFAPEYFKCIGYNEDVDWWSLGITFYECVYGTRPWLHCTNIDDLGKQILHRKIPFPYKQSISVECVSALKSFLEKDPKKRLGHGIISGWNKIASHPFFRSVDWYTMDNKQCQPLYIPRIQPFTIPQATTAAADDLLSQQTSHKTTTTCSIIPKDITPPLDEEEGVMGWLNRYKRSSRTLQKQNRFSQDLKIIQDKFKPFDYTIFDQYQGFLDERLMTVGPPPDWVKPAFPDADNGSILPIRKIYLETPSVFDVFGDHHYMMGQQCK
ncbi:citrate (Si)-synthase [Mucor velutinosus]|uniref:non-specific serine/threonine protein kinase n=1 Tax=Mucor velutinosus TaxID=708070 RepID=A0AAN7DIF8_9FUNG|nr:citrate (Si)-synthase [Mucor velutinosus]